METTEKNVIKGVVKNLKNLSADILRRENGMNNVVMRKSVDDNANVLEMLISIDDEQTKDTNKNVIKGVVKNLKNLSADILRRDIGMIDLVIHKSVDDNANVLEMLISIDDEQTKYTNKVRDYYRQINQQSRKEDT
jgi:uncharacterized protein YjgD (DUF1641 family)